MAYSARAATCSERHGSGGCLRHVVRKGSVEPGAGLEAFRLLPGLRVKLGPPGSPLKRLELVGLGRRPRNLLLALGVRRKDHGQKALAVLAGPFGVSAIGACAAAGTAAGSPATPPPAAALPPASLTLFTRFMHAAFRNEEAAGAVRGMREARAALAAARGAREALVAQSFGLAEKFRRAAERQS